MINAEAFEWPEKMGHLCLPLSSREDVEWTTVNWFQVRSFLSLKVKKTFLLDDNVKRNVLGDV